ncbi:MAG: glycosyltransferase family 2 protein [Candidatus Marinimicrobia bacterium]|nr:glycosyltransferase family 2 protein [Candidatus Neomarinimicrobiota bacterium]MCF7851220.1 glycosyltransferase family 2 protein [Candidatus Neomarinimicrobiota bacterium]
MENKQTNKPAFQPIILIPVYNGRDSLYTLNKQIASITDLPVIVVNDGSTDGLMENDLQGVIYLKHDENRGKGAALKTGLQRAKSLGYTHCITLDADGQHDPQFLPKFINLQKSYPDRLVVGARDLSDPSMPFHRKLSNNITSLMVSLRIGAPVLDAQVGYRSYPLKDSRLWESIEDGFQFESDVFFKVSKLNYKLAWQPVSVIYNGASSNMEPVWDTLRFVRTYFRSFMC